MGSGSVLRLVKSCFVTPSGETPRKRLWLSALDLVLASRGHTPLVHFYSAGDGSARLLISLEPVTLSKFEHAVAERQVLAGVHARL
uniref:Predicted protein n=1 Tax=Hordeum vulgare subsp. vulgare TaxID=112509 RepID=F2DEF6_HORVV|nr:predicted protein [Hordeum vulgare subsp. vulgare]